MEDQSTPRFDGWPFIIGLAVLLGGYAFVRIVQAAGEAIAGTIERNPWTVFVPAFAFVIGVVGVMAWFGSHRTTGTAAPVQAVYQAERTPITGNEFEREIVIRVPTSVTAVNDVIEYRFRRIRVIEVYLISETRTSLTNVDWKSPKEAGIGVEAFEIKMQEKRVRILDFTARGFYQEDFAAFTGGVYDDILRTYSTPSPTPEEGA